MNVKMLIRSTSTTTILAERRRGCEHSEGGEKRGCEHSEGGEERGCEHSEGGERERV